MQQFQYENVSRYLFLYVFNCFLSKCFSYMVKSIRNILTVMASQILINKIGDIKHLSKVIHNKIIL